MEIDMNSKVREYECFLNDTLKEDLKFLEKKLKEVNEKLSNWLTLKKTISEIKECKEGFKTYADLGCGISCKAIVSDTSVININVGLNIYLKLTMDDAYKYCDFRINILEQEVEHIKKQAIQVNAHIKIVLLGLQEIQALV